MSNLDDIAVVRSAHDAVNARDLPALVELTAEDFVFYPAFAGGGLVEGAVYRGREGMRRFFDEQDETWSEITFALEDAIDLGDAILARVTIHAVGRGSGLQMHQPSWGVYRITAGKLAEGRIFTSEADARVAAARRGD